MILAKTLSATLASFLIAASALCQAVPTTGEQFAAVVQGTDEAMRAHLFNPELLTSADYLATRQKLVQLSRQAVDRNQFVSGFNAIWQSGPFSHVRLDVARQSAEALATQLDSMRIGGGGAVLTWENEIAVLTVNSMMGLDTIEVVTPPMTASQAHRHAR